MHNANNQQQQLYAQKTLTPILSPQQRRQNFKTLKTGSSSMQSSMSYPNIRKSKFKAVKYIKLGQGGDSQIHEKIANPLLSLDRNSYEKLNINEDLSELVLDEKLFPSLKQQDQARKFKQLNAIPETSEFKSPKNNSQTLSSNENFYSKQGTIFQKNPNDLKQVELLLKSGFDLNVTDRQRRNLIHYLAIKGSAQMLQIVTEYLKYISNLQNQLQAISKTTRATIGEKKNSEKLSNQGHQLNLSRGRNSSLNQRIASNISDQHNQLTKNIPSNFSLENSSHHFPPNEKLLQLSQMIDQCFKNENDVIEQLRKRQGTLKKNGMKASNNGDIQSLSIGRAFSEQKFKSKDYIALTQQTHTHQFKPEFLHYKRSLEFSGSLKHINQQDSKGLTPLHVAVINRNLEIIIFLLNNGANLFLIDNRRKMAVDYIKVENEEDIEGHKMLALLLEKMKYKESHYFEHLALKKIKIDKSHRLMSEQELKQPTSLQNGGNLKLQLNEKILASFSNKLLESFQFGSHSDNALLYCIRINNLEFFKYFVKRKIRLSVIDGLGFNALHYCVAFDRLDFLRFLFQDFQTKLVKTLDQLDDMMFETDRKHHRTQSENIINQKSMLQPIEIRIEKFFWVQDALKCLDKAALVDGNTVLHKASQIGNLEMINFIIQTVIQRERLIKTEKDQGYLNLSDVLEFTNNVNQTPLFVAAKYNNLDCISFLYDHGANIYTVDNKMENVLHYAIYNENEQMIKFLVNKDSKFMLRREKNIYDKIPIDLEKAQKFMTWLYTIWDAVDGGISNLVASYVKQRAYDVNQKRPGDLRTPLHIAVIGLKFDMVKLLIQLGADPIIVDIQGHNCEFYLSHSSDPNVKNIRRLLHRRISKAVMNSQGESGSQNNLNELSLKGLSINDDPFKNQSDFASVSNQVDARSQFSIPKVNIISVQEGGDDVEERERMDKLICEMNNKQLNIEIQQLDELKINFQQDMTLIQEKPEDKQVITALRRSSSQMNIENINLNQEEQLLISPKNNQRRRRTSKVQVRKNSGGAQTPISSNSSPGRRGSHNTNFFQQIDVQQNGFVVADQVVEAMKSMKQLLDSRIKFKNMIHHLEVEMKDCLITDEIFKTLMRQFAKIQQ
eukprot:403370620